MNAAGERSIAIATICDATFWNSRSVRRGSIFALQDYLLFAMLLTGRPWENRMGNNQGPSKRWFGIRIATNMSDRKAITHHCFGLCSNDCWHLGVIFDLIQLLHAASCCLILPNLERRKTNTDDVQTTPKSYSEFNPILRILIARGASRTTDPSFKSTHFRSRCLEF